MKMDIYGDALPDVVWHGSTNVDDGKVIKSAAEIGSWWNVMDHDTFLNPCFDDEDDDQRQEMDFTLRTAYGNMVYDAFLNSNRTELQSLAYDAGLEKLGDKVGIIFVTSDQQYAENRYGPSYEIDLNSDAIIAIIPDDNVAQADCWLLVLKPGLQFPIKLHPEFDIGSNLKV